MIESSECFVCGSSIDEKVEGLFVCERCYIEIPEKALDKLIELKLENIVLAKTINEKRKINNEYLN